MENNCSVKDRFSSYPHVYYVHKLPVLLLEDFKISFKKQDPISFKKQAIYDIYLKYKDIG